MTVTATEASSIMNNAYNIEEKCTRLGRKELEEAIPSFGEQDTCSSNHVNKLLST